MKKILILIGISLLGLTVTKARTPHVGTVAAKKGGVQVENLQVETLCRSSSAWDGQALVAYPAGVPELTVLKITIPANTALSWHKHPMPNAAYILCGTLTIEKKNGRKKKFTPGQACLEVVNEWHRGRAGNTPVILIVFYAGTPGMPLSQPFCP